MRLLLPLKSIDLPRTSIMTTMKTPQMVKRYKGLNRFACLGGNAFLAYPDAGRQTMTGRSEDRTHKNLTRERRKERCRSGDESIPLAERGCRINLFSANADFSFDQVRRDA